MNKKHLYVLAVGLTLTGLILFLYKAFVLDFPLVPETRDYIWNIETHVSFVAEDQPVKVAIFVPRNSRRFTIVNENFISRGYGVSVATEDGKRQVRWSIRKAKGKQSLYYEAAVRRIDRDPLPPVTLKSELEKPDFTGARLEAAKAIISDLSARSADIDGQVAGLLQQLNVLPPGDNLTLLLGKNASIQKKVNLAVQLLSLGGIHARAVHGIQLKDQQRNAAILHWLEVYDNRKWVAYDPVAAQRGVPDDYLSWWRGMEPLAQSQGISNLEVSLSATRSAETAIRSALEKGRISHPLLLDFSLFSLPIRTQAVYHVVLLVPVGVFFLVMLRNVIGVRTFGTFMPVLIALAFRETQLVWGVVLFTVLITLGLLVRSYLERLKLLVVPRLAALLIVVIGLMAFLSVLTHKIGLERGLSVALFPMVILTMTIERMSIVWEERGAVEAIKQGAGSMIAAAIVYLIMSVKYIDHLVFVFPELLLILLAATLLLGRYSGYRLLELRRFKALAEIGPDV